MQVRQQSSRLYDILAFLALAAALGLAAGVVLGSLALLLAAPAHGAEPQEGALLLLRSDGEAMLAPHVSTNVVFKVTGSVARARVVQTFRNPRKQWFEGVYVFPLPERAAVDGLRMRVGERLVEGEIQERSAAARIYKTARSGGQRAVLFDQERPNIFTTQVANIGPRETVVVEVDYQQTLRYDGNRFSLRFPMVVGPRYFPAGPLPVTDAHRITPPVLRPGSDANLAIPVSIRVELDAGLPIAHLHSAYHEISVQSPSASRRVVTLANGMAPADRDFELAWIHEARDMPQATWFAEEQDERYYGLLMVFPPASKGSARLAREVIYVLDISGSMAGASINQAREALILALARLAPDDTFNVVAFNSSAHSLFRQAQDARPDAVQRAITWVRSLDARGGTEIASALRLALQPAEDSVRVRQVVFLTDGAVGNEEQLFELIEARLGESRLFTVGIGSAPNSHFMKRAAEVGRGTFTYIGRIDEVGARMGELFAKLESPVMKGVEVRWPEDSRAEAWPKRIPDLYAGEPLMLTVSLQKLGGEARIIGMRDGTHWQATVPLIRNAAHAGMGTLWARDKVAALMNLAREAGSTADVRPEIIALAKSHRLVTRYTSLVAVDRFPGRGDGEQLESGKVPTMLPAGWDYAKIYGELPQGGTDSRLALLSGSLILFLATLLYLVRRRLA